MLEIKSIDNKSVLVINFDTIHLFKNENEVISYEHSAELTSASYLPNKNLIAFTDLTKKFYLLDYENNNKFLTTKLFQKRAAKLLTNKAESVILLGDKTGDVYSLNLNDLENSEFKLIMGHLSMLTDMKLSKDEKFLLTSDRDEKIRISHYPNSYNIEGYLLAHKEFVMQFEFIDESNLASVSGDSKLILWDLKTFKPKQIIDCKILIENDSQLNGIDKFDFDPETNQIFVHLFKSNFLLQFTYFSNSINFERKIVLDSFDDFVRLSNNYYLFTNLNDESSSKFSIKKFQQNFIDLDQNDTKMNLLLNSINKIVKFKKASDVKNEIEKNYESYFKAIVNNMDDYYQRKQERILANAGKRKHKISQSESEVTESKVTVQ